MGGGSGSFTTSIDVNKLINAANQRIKDAFEASSNVLFCCNHKDTAALLDKISKTSAFAKINHEVIDESSTDWMTLVSQYPLMIVFVDKATDHTFINIAIKKATDERKIVIFTPNNDRSPVPQYIVQLRVRSMTWTEVSQLLS